MATHPFFRLTHAALLTFADKLRRDGIVVLAKTLYALCVAESPVKAIAGQRKTIALFELPSLASLKPLPLANKYLSGYMAKNFSKQDRRQILLHHYRYIADRTSEDFYARIVRPPCILWRMIEGGGAYAIGLTFNERSHYEGDLSLVFLEGEARVFELSFAIVPGSVIGSACKDVLLIGRVQGAKDQFDAIRRTTKACHDIAPQHMLMVAAQSIAKTFDIRAIAGVDNDNQVANLPNKYFVFDYDAFWQAMLATKNARGFYEMPVPLPQKPLRDIQVSHRRRSRKKREFRESVGRVIAEASAPVLLGKTFVIKADRRRSAACFWPDQERRKNPSWL